MIAPDGTPKVQASIAFAASLTIVGVPVGSGANRALVVTAAWRGDTTEPTVTYGGVALTKIGPATSPAFSGGRCNAWLMLNPPTGTANVVVTSGQLEFFASACAQAWTDVGGTTGWASASGFSNTPNVSLTGVLAGEVSIDVLAHVGSTIAAGAGQTTLADTVIGTVAAFGSSYDATGTGTVSMDWATDNDDWVIGAFRLQPAAPSSPTAVLTGTAAAGLTEAQVVAGATTLIATLTGDTFVPDAAVVYVGGMVGGRAGNITPQSTNFALTGGIDTVPRTGDLVLITVTVGSAGRNTPCAITTPAGYTAYGQLTADGTSGDTSTEVSRKVMGSTPDTAFTLPSSGDVNDAQRYTVQVFRNVDSTTPDDVASTTATGAGTARPDPAAITPVTPGAVVVICGAGATAATANPYVAPANFATNFLTGISTDTTDAMIGSGYMTGWTSGAVDPAVYTGGSTQTADSWTARTIALRPAVSPNFAAVRAALRDGLTSAQSEATGWNATVRPNIPLANIVRTSNTVCTVTLQAQADYDITADETITWTIPAVALVGAAPMVATPTIQITRAGGTTVVEGDGSSSGLATVAGVGALTAASVGTASGGATVAGVGALTAASVGTASGLATVAGASTSGLIVSSVGAASGLATVAAIGRRFVAAIGTASGGATVAGVAPGGPSTSTAGIYATPPVLDALREVLAAVTGITAIYTEGSVPATARTDYLVIGPFTERPDNTMGSGRRWGSELTTTIKLVSMNPDIGVCMGIIEQVIILLNAVPLDVEGFSAGMATLDIAVDSFAELVSGQKVWHYPTLWTVRVHQ